MVQRFRNFSGMSSDLVRFFGFFRSLRISRSAETESVNWWAMSVRFWVTAKGEKPGGGCKGKVGYAGEEGGGAWRGISGDWRIGVE